MRAMDGGDGRLGWNFAFNASTNSNTLTGITGAVNQVLVGGVAGGVGTTIQVLRPGEPINSFFVYRHRTDASGNPVWATGPGADTAMYVDQNGDNIINVDDRVAYKNPRPKWQLGFSNYLTYGRLSLDFTLRAYLGNYVYNNVSSNLGTYSEVTRASPYNLHRSVLETSFETPQYLSDYYVEDASFLRLDNITLAYRFNYRNQPVRVFGTVQNAFTLTGYSGVDPTAGLNGIDNNIYPRSRTFTGGISLQF
jgi:iron complex outermembrane receptor protein